MAFIATLTTTLLAATKLVVLQHGLYGGAINLRVLQKELQLAGGDDVLVHSAASNEGRTRDGVAAGGKRLASEVRHIVRCNPSLESLSFVGNSLGGLYARYAAAELHDVDAGTMAGLRPDAYVTIGSPHLGVRRFTYLPLPPVLQRLGVVVAGRTAQDLLLQDGESPADSLLVEMAYEGGRYHSALRAFDRRRLYANLKGDFMVPFGTASIELDASGGGTGSGGDGDRWGAGIGDAARAAAFARGGEGCTFYDEAVLTGRSSGICAVRTAPQPQPSPAQPREEESERQAHARLASTDPEEAMRRALERCGWSKVACSWRSATTAAPIAHNKLPALRREGWRRGFEAIEGADEGRPVMVHAAGYLLGKLEAAELALEGAHGALRTSGDAMAHASQFVLQEEEPADGEL